MLNGGEAGRPLAEYGSHVAIRGLSVGYWSVPRDGRMASGEGGCARSLQASLAVFALISVRYSVRYFASVYRNFRFETFGSASSSAAVIGQKNGQHHPDKRRRCITHKTPT